jgi:hypothetical protein
MGECDQVLGNLNYWMPVLRDWQIEQHLLLLMCDVGNYGTNQ